jgi:precorrin-6Y C5,15-methyltransferase (decarboxylating)
MKTNQKISIVGIGMGNRDTLTIEAYETIRAADCLIGSKRLLDIFCDLNVPKTEMIASEKISDYIHNHPAYSHIVILMSGDVGFYSGATLLAPQLEQYSVKFYPGISSLQYLSARLGLPWNDTKIVSLHGRHENLIAAVNTMKKRSF